MKVPLYSVACHPLDTHEMCVAGRGRKVMVFDRRKVSLHAKPVKSYCPEFFRTSVSLMIASCVFFLTIVDFRFFIRFSEQQSSKKKEN